jgi:subtilisin
MAGAAQAGKSERKIVGLTADAGFHVATERGEEIDRELDFGSIGKAVAGTFPDTAVAAFEADPKVRYVEEDGRVHALGQTTPWGVDRVDADVVHEEGHTGEGAHVAIVDTGIDGDHPDLQANVGEGKAFATCSDGDCTHDWTDDNGHGTHCAGIADGVDNEEGVVGVSTGATLHAVKVLSGDGGGSFSDVAAGVEYVADQGWDVASLSLGGSSGSSTIRDACQYASQNGVLVVAAAGNDGPCSDCVGYPAAYDEVMAVSSTTSEDGLSEFSSTGPEVEIAAPGSDIYSTYEGGDYKSLSGTSMACPHVSGAAGQLMAEGLSNSEARQRLTETAEDVGLGSNESGNGLLDVQAAVTGDDGGSKLSVATDSATSVETETATLNGTLSDLGGAESVEVSFEWGEAGGSLPNETGTRTLSSSGSFSADVSGLSEGTDYEFRAVAATGDGTTDTGATKSFTTDDGEDCYVTTATAGEGHTLDSLRRFRDESMAATPVGRSMIQLYYAISPPVARTLERHPDSHTAEACRRIVDASASLSDAQDETDSTIESASLAVLLTLLYSLGILVGAGGHAGIGLRERLD